MNSIADLRSEAFEALDRVWFIQKIEEVEHTDLTLSMRLRIRPGLFIQVFYGERSASLYFALIEGDRRIFGVDRQHGQWHSHPFDAPETHQPFPEGLEPKPLLTFLAKVEQLLLTDELL